MKKINYVFFAILVFVLGYFTYLKAESLFFKTNKSNAKKDEVVKIVLDFNSIEYDKFNVLITSSDSVSKLQTNDISAVNTGNNEISFDIDKISTNIHRSVKDILQQENALRDIKASKTDWQPKT